MNNYIIEDGLLKFTSLQNDPLQIITTYDNKIWGNMNPFYAKDDSDKDRISKNDEKLSDLLETSTNFVMTTPPENTILNLNSSSYKYLQSINIQNDVDEYLPLYIHIRANSILFSKQEEKVSIIVAPADCPVVVITDKRRSFVIVTHMGFPQFLQNLHIDTIVFAKSNYDLDQELDIFVTPYICSNHYLISMDRYEKSVKQIGSKLEQYSKEVYSDIWKENRYSIDISKILKAEIQMRLPKSNIIETGICTYEEANKGNLFSHKYVTDQKQLGKEINEGNFNVVVNL